MANHRLSKYVKRFDKGGYSALFHGLTLKKIYASSNILDSALSQAFKDDCPHDNFLIQNQFICTEDQEQATLERLRSEIGNINITNIVMLVDNRCNFRCAYCQIEENMNKIQMAHSMTIDIAKQALDLFESNSRNQDKKTVSITGGEPLMNIPVVKYILERANTIPNSRAIIFTNGSLITKDLAAYFAKTNALMLVSLDGPKDIHNTFRLLKNGKQTFASSLSGFELLREAGCKTGISSVTGTHNINRIDEVIDFFIRLGISSLGLNFGHHLLGKENPTVITMEQYADFLIRVYCAFRERGIFVENISRFITPFIQEKPRFNECQAQGRGFCIDSRGKIGVCKSLLVSDEISKPIEHMSGRISSEPAFKTWANRSPFSLMECKGCHAIGICGGGCTYDAFAVNHGNISRIDSRLCAFSDKILEFLIWDMFEEIKEKMSEKPYIPDIKEQEYRFQKHFDPGNQLQRSVGHEKDK